MVKNKFRCLENLIVSICLPRSEVNDQRRAKRVDYGRDLDFPTQTRLIIHSYFLPCIPDGMKSRACGIFGSVINWYDANTCYYHTV